ncbi:MAG: hypothetical protein M1294_10390 [Firmicutes bacterium]|jgi:hypothetical protein|nr:hypothetical protein [Bacillota bacterium]MCL5013210.1 hypothetical protein [Bacillota bacterium]
MATLSCAVEELSRRLKPSLTPSPWIVRRSPYECEAVEETDVPHAGLRVQVMDDTLPASHRLTFFFPSTMVVAHADQDFDDWVDMIRAELDTSSHQGQWLYDPGTGGMWVHATVLGQQPMEKYPMPRAWVDCQGLSVQTASGLASACRELRQALTQGWGSFQRESPDSTDPALKDVVIISQPIVGLQITVWYYKFPATHWLRILIPQEIVDQPEHWDQFPMRLHEDVLTYGHRSLWQFDPDTGGMQFLWR